MSRVMKRLACTALALSIGLVSGEPVHAGGPPDRGRAPEIGALRIVRESAVYHPSIRLVLFTVKFDRRPNFRDEDDYGRQADSFQYFIYGDESLEYPANFDTIIRGEEIDLARRRLPIRSSVPPDADPESGGWGPVRARVPFLLHGRVLVFAAPLRVVSDHSTNGHFAYRVETYRFGGATETVENESIVAPR